MLLLNYEKFTYGSIVSEDYGVYVLDVQEDDWGRRDVDTEPVHGRSGDIIIDNGRLNNTKLIITVAVVKDAEQRFSALNAALLATVGYNRLEHSYDKDTYRQARYIGGVSPKLTRRGDICTAELPFDCEPQKYWKSGEATYEINIGASASTKLYKTGYMGELMSDAFKSLQGNSMPYEPITILNLGSDIGTYVIYLFYPDDKMGKEYVFGHCDEDPTSSEYSSGVNGFGTVDGMMILSANSTYAYFSTPARWRVDVRSVAIDRTYSAETIIENASPFPSSPIIQITTKAQTDYDNTPVLMVNDKDIRLIDENSSLYSDDNVLYVDCETMNAYRIIGDGVKENMNQCVVLPNKSITLKSGTNTIYTNSNIRAAEIIPRWWSR